MAKNVDAALTLTLLSPTVIMRIYYSSYHLFAAKLFADRAATLEGDASRPVFDVEERANVTAAILSAVGFLEGAVNELYADTVDKHRTGLTPECVAAMKIIWSEFETGDRPKGLNVFDKYQLALRLAGKPEIEEGKAISQNAACLVKLRNALTHFKPTDRKLGASAELTKLEKDLRYKFSKNRHMGGMKNPLFPDHYLGAGCAAWAVKSAKAFADEFFSCLGIESNYQQVGFEIDGRQIKLTDYVK